MSTFSIPLSGLDAASTAMSTIANNLANLNTVGYKGSNTQFSDLFYQTLGLNGADDPMQVGSGTEVSAIVANMNAGSVESTGVPTDAAIMGNGFFVVQKNGTTYYTRAGDFSIGADGSLQTPNGEQVMGYAATNGVVSPGASLAPLEINAGQTNAPSATATVQLTTNLDAGAAAGNTPVLSTPVTVYDSLGTAHILTFNFTKTAAGAWNVNITIPSSDLTSPGQGSQTSITPQPIALTFDANGNLKSPAGNVPLTISGLADGASDMSFNWDLDNSAGTPTVTQVNGPSTTSSTSQDGFGSGTLTNYNIDSDGTIMGTFSNGRSAALGQIALANFANTQGLERVGSNDFSATLASGPAAVGAPGTGGLGTVAGGSLELSNVDIATEFSNLIVAQQDYEANAHTITTFNQVMTETINMASTP